MKMPFLKYILPFFILLLCTITRSWAAHWTSDITLSPKPVNFSAPANSSLTGQIVGSSWAASASVNEVIWCGFVWTCERATMQPGSGLVTSGGTVLVDGINHTIFETGIKGLGFILSLKGINASNYLPLQNGQTQIYPTPDLNEYTPGLALTARMAFVKTSSGLVPGIYTTPSIEAALLTAINNETTTAKVIIEPTTINVSATGCTVLTKNANVDLGPVDIRSFPAVGATSPSRTFNISLSCQEQVSVYASIIDQTHPENHSAAATLTSDSTAGWLGVQFSYNNEVLSLGLDSSAAGSMNQFFVYTTTHAETLNLPFQVRYIRMGDIVPGTANSLAAITFSYQ